MDYSLMQNVGRYLLAGFLGFAGIAHFAIHDTFTAQVPPWMPQPSAVIYVSGLVEIALALALVFLRRYRRYVGWATAVFFLIIFPGNISQFVTGTDAFGLNSDSARFMRLLFQPVLIAWALWCTWPRRRRRESATTSGVSPQS